MFRCAMQQSNVINTYFSQFLLIVGNAYIIMAIKNDFFSNFLPSLLVTTNNSVYYLLISSFHSLAIHRPWNRSPSPTQLHLTDTWWIFQKGISSTEFINGFNLHPSHEVIIDLYLHWVLPSNKTVVKIKNILLEP